MRESQERSGGKSTTITRAHRVEFKRRSGSLNNYLDCRTPCFYALSPWIINRCNEARTISSSKQLSINHPAACASDVERAYLSGHDVLPPSQKMNEIKCTKTEESQSPRRLHRLHDGSIFRGAVRGRVWTDPRRFFASSVIDRPLDSTVAPCRPRAAQVRELTRQS